MNVVKIKIDQVLGIQHLEIDKPGPFLEVTGENGSGKTSVLEAVKSLGAKGHDATLLRAGAEKGEIVFVLEDGVEVTKTITATGTDTKVQHPEFGKISKPAAYIQKLVDALSLNPVEFLTAKADARVDLLLKAIPMTVTADQLKFLPVAVLYNANLNGHALPVLEKLAKAVYDLRTGVNRAVKEKRDTVKTLSEGLPSDAPGGENWADVLQKVTGEYRELQRSTQLRIDGIKADCTTAIQGQRELFAGKRDGVKAEVESKIDQLRREFEIAAQKIRDDGEIEISRCMSESEKSISEAETHKNEALKAVDDDYQPKFADVNRRLGEAKAKHEEHVRSESTRNLISEQKGGAEKLEAEGKKLTAALDGLEALKLTLCSELPIKGLEIKENEIYLDGIVFDRVNLSRKVRLAIELAKLRAGTIPLIVCDGLEILDKNTFDTFRKEAAKSNCQFVVSRVTEGPLTVENGDAA